MRLPLDGTKTVLADLGILRREGHKSQFCQTKAVVVRVIDFRIGDIARSEHVTRTVTTVW
jgi:hypothetical protein